MSDSPKVSRRRALRVLGTAAAALGVGGVARAGGDDAAGVRTSDPWFRRFFRKHYRRMTPEEVDAMVERLEARYRKRYGREIEVKQTPARDDAVYGYALSVDRCLGYRDCVHACQKEQNASRDPEIQYIRVFEVDAGRLTVRGGDPDYDRTEVPAPGKAYLPVQCFHCDNPPCVTACPVDATWKEKDGIVVIDYDRCIGCRYCIVSCPYGARRFNWSEPEIPADELTTDTHYLGNRPRPVGVVEKCNFCVHRVREGRQPACQEACPTGARVFGNLLDPDSEIRQVLRHKKVFRLKEELGTEPKFWYFME